MTLFLQNQKGILKGVAFIGLSLIVSGCILSDRMDVENIRNTHLTMNTGSLYETALAKEYKKIALYEADEMYDVIDAGYFARKSLNAFNGDRPVAERTQDWDLKFGEKRIQAARKRLNALLSRNAAQKEPLHAARAQAHFDCWVEQVEEGWQFDHIEQCQTVFHASILTLEKALSTPERVYFDVNESAVALSEQKMLTALIDEAKRQDAPLASIVGYADTTGENHYNLKLSLQRADAVADILVKSGYPQERIAVSAYGESRLAVPTQDNALKRQNRRVEIMFYPHTAF